MEIFIHVTINVDLTVASIRFIIFRMWTICSYHPGRSGVFILRGEYYGVFFSNFFSQSYSNILLESMVIHIVSFYQSPTGKPEGTFSFLFVSQSVRPSVCHKYSFRSFLVPFLSPSICLSVRQSVTNTVSVHYLSNYHRY